MNANNSVNRIDVLGLIPPPPALPAGCKGWKKKGVGINTYAGILNFSNGTALFNKWAKAGGKWAFEASDAQDMFSALETVKNEDCCNCISVLTLAGHGYGEGARGTAGIPFYDDDEGLYEDTSGRDLESRSFSELETAVKDGEIRFCSTCVIQIHSCRITGNTLRLLGKATGCTVIGSYGACNESLITRAGELWSSGPKSIAEKLKGYCGFQIYDPKTDTIKPYGTPWCTAGSTMQPR
jgi:hypothetical protein